MSGVNQDDIDLNYFEGIRKDLIKELTKGKIPTDPETAGLLLKALDGGSRVILTKKRIEVEKDGNELEANSQALVSEILRSIPTAKQRRERSVPLADVDVVVPKPGETNIGTSQITYNEIMKTEDGAPQK